ncbi:hypothetical protein J2Z66_006879 [Paenibacillus eucommiae]|uniref:DUF4044 domain-containing protein n=1 Tax=Paenibacillus eucommiae TaxID=1355755 RepID=A0ABS4J5Z1_9BACL|nr:hypothetical protein [Paenibacillus eucommiae]
MERKQKVRLAIMLAIMGVFLVLCGLYQLTLH